MPHRLDSVFQSLAFVVIDELHSFIGTERGAHLRSLISRLAAKSRKPVRRAGLSATLGPEIEQVRRWLRPSQPDAVRLIEDPEKKSIQLRISGYLKHPIRREDGGRRDDDEIEARSKAIWREMFSIRSTARPP